MQTATFQPYKPKQKHSETFWVKIGIEDKQTDRLQAVHKGFRLSVYHNLLKKTKLSQTEFVHVTLIPASTLKRRLKSHERFSITESDTMYRLAALLKQATDLFAGDEEKANRWMKAKIYGLNQKRPIDMVSTSVDFQVVQDLIGRIRHGIVS